MNQQYHQDSPLGVDLDTQNCSLYHIHLTMEFNDCSPKLKKILYLWATKFFFNFGVNHLSILDKQVYIYDIIIRVKTNNSNMYIIIITCILTHSKMSSTNAIPSAGGCRVIIRNKFLDRLLRESCLKLNSLKKCEKLHKEKIK